MLICFFLTLLWGKTNGLWYVLEGRNEWTADGGRRRGGASERERGYSSLSFPSLSFLASFVFVVEEARASDRWAASASDRCKESHRKLFKFVLLFVVCLCPHPQPLHNFKLQAPRHRKISSVTFSCRKKALDLYKLSWNGGYPSRVFWTERKLDKAVSSDIQQSKSIPC